MSLKLDFSKAFVKSDLVLICPIYAAGEKRNLNFNLFNLYTKNRLFICESFRIYNNIYFYLTFISLTEVSFSD